MMAVTSVSLDAGTLTESWIGRAGMPALAQAFMTRASSRRRCS